MPLALPENLGTETDGTPSAEYCTYCYRDGRFTLDCTMEQMIAQCAEFHDQFQDEPDEASHARKPSQRCGRISPSSNAGGGITRRSSAGGDP